MADFPHAIRGGGAYRERPATEPRDDSLLRQHHYLDFHNSGRRFLRHVLVRDEHRLSLPAGQVQHGASERRVGCLSSQHCQHLLPAATNSRYLVPQTETPIPPLASRTLGLELPRLHADRPGSGHAILRGPNSLPPSRSPASTAVPPNAARSGACTARIRASIRSAFSSARHGPTSDTTWPPLFTEIDAPPGTFGEVALPLDWKAQWTDCADASALEDLDRPTYP